jgi:hypothetical protein
MVPLGPGLWRAHRSSSVIGTGMQKPPVPQGPHGELVEVSVIGEQVLAAAAVAVSVSLLTFVASIAVMRHGADVGAGAGAGAGSIAISSDAIAESDAVRAVLVDPPVSNTFTTAPRVKVNLGHTFSVESNVLAFIFIDPVEDLKTDRPTLTSHDSVAPLL